MKFLKDSKIRF